MLIAAVGLVVFIAAAFMPGEEEARWGVFTDEATCQASVANVRARGAFATDCVKVTMPTPKNGVTS